MKPPELRTRRLVLRPLLPADADAIEKLGGRDFEVARWTTGFAWPYEEGSAETFVEEALSCNPAVREAVFAVTLGGVFIGVVAMEAPGDLEEYAKLPTLGYWIGRPFQGFGYAFEAAQAVLDWAFEAHGAPGFAARVFKDNGRSRKLLEKIGFVSTGQCKRYSRARGEVVENFTMCLERKEFEKRYSS
ncbi:GNAT family N-acetyltransferase [Rhizobiales bacterium]|nr:GNAT family N-acetyltransferase [Hongsoonwoonella zoysiae]